MNEYRIEKLLKCQLVANIVNSIVAFATSAYLATDTTDSIIYIAAITIPLYFILRKVFNFISTVYFQLKFYGTDIDQLREDAAAYVDAVNNPQHHQEEVYSEQKFTIVDLPSFPYAKFMDADIYEWMDLEDADGQKKRFFFLGTVDISKDSINLPPGSVIFPPGIIYQDETIINNST